MARTPDGPPPAPAVQRLRIRYAKRGRLRFTSHRDFQRAFERALRRAGVPMAYSAGFSPHPKVSYAGAAATGVASEAEYLEIAVTQRLDAAETRAALDDCLPPGLDVLEVVEAVGVPLAERLVASVWEARLSGLDTEQVAGAGATFLAAERVEVTRLTKSGVRRFDARAAVVSLAAQRVDGLDGEACAILRMVVRHVTPAVRPDDILNGLRQTCDLEPPAPPLVIRLAQGPLDESAGTVSDPLMPDRDAIGAAASPAVQP